MPQTCFCGCAPRTRVVSGTFLIVLGVVVYFSLEAFFGLVAISITGYLTMVVVSGTIVLSRLAFLLMSYLQGDNSVSPEASNVLW